MTSEQIFAATFKVRFDECDPQGQLDPSSLISYLLETATGASDAVDRGPSAMRQRGLAWFLHRLHLQIDGDAGHRDHLTVRTWPFGLDRIFAVREIQAWNAAGKSVARATSRWMVVDFERRRLIRLPAWVRQGYRLRNHRLIADLFDPLPRPDPPELARELTIWRQQLDPNGHLNATVYAAACLNAIPEELAGSSQLRALELEFKKEAGWGDQLIVESATAPDMASDQLHAVRRASDGEVSALGRSRWQSNETQTRETV